MGRRVGPRLLLSAILLLGLFLLSSGESPQRVAAEASRRSAKGISPLEAPGSGGRGSGQSEELSLAFAGDIMAHPINYEHRPYSAIYEAVAPVLHASDLAFANLELTIDPGLPLAGWPRFAIHPDYVQASIAAGFNVFSDANNHINDYGTPGIESTYRVMEGFARTEDIHFSGIRPSPETPMRPVTIERQGFRIGFLAITEFLNYGLHSDLVNTVDYRDPTARERFISYLRSITGRYDLFILSVHGGIEYDLNPEPAKQEFFHEALEAGVSIVWCQHPHVLEPWEVVTVDGLRRLIIYSNGNFISGQISEINPATPWVARSFTGDSAIFRVLVGRIDGKATVLSVDPLLISNYKNREGEMVVRPLAELASGGLPAPWSAYYRYRYEVMRMLVARENAPQGQRVAAPEPAGLPVILRR